MRDRNHEAHVAWWQASLFGLVLAVAVAALTIPLDGGGEVLHAGDVAPRALVAPADTQYDSQVQTAAQRDLAAAAVADIYFPPDPSAQQRQLTGLTALLDGFRTLRQRTDLTQSQKLDQAEQIPGVDGVASSSTLFLLLDFDNTTFATFATLAAEALGDILQGPVEPGLAGATVASYLDCLPGAAACSRPGDPEELAAFRDLLNAFVVENVSVDEQATTAARAAARSSVSVVTITFPAGQVIVAEGEALDAADIEALRMTGVLEDGFDWWRAAGAGLMAVGIGLLAAVYAYRLQPFEAPVGTRVITAAIVIVALLVAARAYYPFVMPDSDGRYLALILPLPAAAMIVALFSDLSFSALVAVAMGMAAAFMAAVIPDLPGSEFVGPLEGLQLGMAVTAGGLGGASVVSRSAHPFRILGGGAFAAAGVVAVLGTFWLLGEPRANRDALWLTGVGLTAGAGSALLTLVAAIAGLGPSGEATRAVLHRHAQPGHPVLRRLETEAPGTYHHSMMVATLAERAAARIGADALLARVGALYHDIGKLGKPRYFIENQFDGQGSPHSSLPPAESASIIRGHVTDGLELAREYDLPAELRLFIPQHHGTRLVTYFFREATREDPGVDSGAFRYPGPRPQTRETAIVMLADSCEAVIRSQEEKSIEATVDAIIAERVSEGQLNECDLTMRELQQVAAAFKETLRAVYHPRIPYPQPVADELALIAAGAGLTREELDRGG